ncbi:chromosome partitioning protein ParB [Fulvitalea axinellae]|uniref:Chromosome partitioning protein ParB n=1 Tax=Fulvitalea axinellae TaxID=1182444 RepID=A0AAU9D8H7_9BACT|nr:chromosome partitioning protein ParB [Fulvitalea axinellae]
MSHKGKRNALGRGLGALLEDSANAQNDIGEMAAVGGISEVSLDNIEVNPFQPRTDFDKDALNELAESIKTQGIIQPITLRRIEANRYQIISGERRVQASRLAGLTSIPAFLRKANDQEMLELALIENIQREDLNSIEIALTYQRLISECGLKQEELGERVGKNRSTVNNYMRLLKLPPEIQAALRDKKISMGHARAIINIDNVDLQLTIFKKILSEDLSVRKVEKLVRELVSGGTARPAQKLDPEKQYHIQRLQQKLTSHFGTKVTVKTNSENKGDIRIPFLSAEDFNRILELLNINS